MSIIIHSIFQTMIIFGSIVLCNWTSLQIYNYLCFPSLWVSIVASSSPLCNVIMYIHNYGTSLYTSMLYLLLTFLITKVGYHLAVKN